MNRWIQVAIEEAEMNLEDFAHSIALHVPVPEFLARSALDHCLRNPAGTKFVAPCFDEVLSNYAIGRSRSLHVDCRARLAKAATTAYSSAGYALKAVPFLAALSRP